jgi:argininosuccinate lyase
MKVRKTLVGGIREDVLSFTVGRDPELDLALAEADCIGTAAHVVMLSRMKVSPPIISAKGCDAVLRALAAILGEVRAGRFRIDVSDQDVHLAVERRLTARLGALGKRVHTGRSRNDQVALDLRLYARGQVMGAIGETAALARELLRFARRNARVPMVGRTHFQPAMPSSVGLWASAHAESLLDDIELLMAAYRLNNRCPLGAAAGYGVPLPLDRVLTSRLLGFSEPVHNTLYAAGGARGKIESVVLSSMAQVMLSLSRLAEDLVLFTAPEFGYFSLPAALCTGSSIMPQKRNPDVMELIRAKAARVMADSQAVLGVAKALPGGYNRDLQETKEPFMNGLATTRACLRMATAAVAELQVDRKALAAGFSAGVFAADRALELVAGGVPFREAYDLVKAGRAGTGAMDPGRALAAKRHLGAPAGLDFGMLDRRAAGAAAWARGEERRCSAVEARLLGVRRAGGARRRG